MLCENLENMEDQLNYYYPFNNSRICDNRKNFSKAKKMIS